MVTIRIWVFVAIGVALARPCDVRAAEPVQQRKNTCPDECQRRAKAAFAFEKLKAEAQARPAPANGPTVAPMPTPVEPKVRALCPCGDRCVCAAGACPACPAAKAPPVASRKLVGYREVCDGRRCYLIPIYEP